MYWILYEKYKIIAYGVVGSSHLRNVHQNFVPLNFEYLRSILATQLRIYIARRYKTETSRDYYFEYFILDIKKCGSLTKGKKNISHPPFIYT